MAERMAFAPKYGANLVLAPAAAAAQVAFDTGSKSVRFCNTGANICYVKLGFAADLTAKPASTADLPIPAGAIVIVSKSQDFDTLSHISASGTTLNAQPGEGGV